LKRSLWQYESDRILKSAGFYPSQNDNHKPCPTTLVSLGSHQPLHFLPYIAPWDLTNSQIRIAPTIPQLQRPTQIIFVMNKQTTLYPNYSHSTIHFGLTVVFSKVAMLAQYVWHLPLTVTLQNAVNSHMTPIFWHVLLALSHAQHLQKNKPLNLCQKLSPETLQYFSTNAFSLVVTVKVVFKPLPWDLCMISICMAEEL
jgi:hypothetical protein